VSKSRAKILLVNPSKYDETGLREKYRFATIPPSGLVLLANRVKKLGNIAVKIVDEWIEDIPFEQHFDLVGITTLFSATFPRVVAISEKFRARGIPVVLGGTHATCAPSEAASVADSVVIGEGEGLFEQVIGDLQSGSGIKPLYKRNGFLDLGREQCADPDYSCLDLAKYLKVGLRHKSNIFPLQTSRGCPMGCGFCSVHITGGRRTRYRPVENVVKDILFLKNTYRASYFGLYDDNLIADAARFDDLMREMKKLDIRFWCQISSTILRNPAMIEKLAEAGCASALVGVESINQRSLDEVSKTFNQVAAYRELFSSLRRHKVTAMASMIFGFDHDSLEVFADSVNFLNSCGVPRALFNILVPFPGTPLHESMTAQGRIEETNLCLYDVAHAVFRPNLMTRRQLEEGFWRAYRDFYKMRRVARRVIHPRNRNRFYILFGSLTFRRQIRKRTFPYNSGYSRIDPDEGSSRTRGSAPSLEEDSSWLPRP